MDAPARALIDLGAIRDNVRALRRHVDGTPLMAVVKSDAYGHGLVPSAWAALAGGAAWLGVIRVAEALELRRAGITAPVLCLMSVPAGDHEAAIRASVDLSASTAAMVGEITSAAGRAGAAARLHLKVDTGMARAGATMAEWPAVVAAALAARAAGTAEIVAVWSHLACADVPGHPSLPVQLKLFADALAVAERAGVKPALRHLANTPATLTLPESRYDLVRTGGGVFGLSTLPGPAPEWLRPAMTVKSRLVQLKRVPAGTAVSYGHRYFTAAPTTLGLIPVGYAEGVPRVLAGALEVAVAGRRRPVAGTVSMNHCVLDLGTAEGPDSCADLGEEVVLFGPGDAGEPTAADWAAAAGTISYEIVTRFAGRLPRSYLEVACEDDHTEAGAATGRPGGATLAPGSGDAGQGVRPWGAR